MPSAEISYGKHLFFRKQFSRRIARITDKYSFCLIRNKLLELGNIRNAEIIVNRSRYRFQGNTVQKSESLIISVIRLYHYYLISPISCNLHCTGKSLTASHLHKKFRYFNINSDLLIILLHQTFSQLHKTSRVRIRKMMHRCTSSHHLIYCALRRLNIRSANIKVINFHALLLGSISERNKFPNRGSRHLFRLIRYLK